MEVNNQKKHKPKRNHKRKKPAAQATPPTKSDDADVTKPSDNTPIEIKVISQEKGIVKPPEQEQGKASTPKDDAMKSTANKQKATPNLAKNIQKGQTSEAVEEKMQQKAQPKPQATGPAVANPAKETPKRPTPVISAEKIEANKLIFSKVEKSREEVLAEREAKKLAKLASKGKTKDETKPEPAPKKDAANTLINEKLVKQTSTDTSLADKMKELQISDEPKAKPSKAERRAIQEAQRAAKTKPVNVKQEESVAKTANPVARSGSKKEKSPSKTVKKIIKTSPTKPHTVRLFNHLYCDKTLVSNIVNSSDIHPAIVKLGNQYAQGIVVGSNARCLAFLKALKAMIQDYKTPPQKEFSRGLEEALNPCITFLQKCRPLAVSMTKALKFIKMHITQLNSTDSDTTQKSLLLDSIDTYVRDQIEKAAQAISISVQQKISNDDVILTYGCSSLIKHILEEANRRKVNFRVIVVDSRPRNEGQEMLNRLVAQGINCVYVLINAVGYVMPEVTIVLLGAHALLANGSVMSRVGTAQIALVAKSHNVPVLVCCETHKFSERVQTDAFVYNEIGNANDLVLNSGTLENRQNNPLSEWESIPNLTPLNLHYDVTPAELVTAVVTELAILPCTSVPVILRINPSEIAY